jgi:hypothetical protein
MVRTGSEELVLTSGIMGPRFACGDTSAPESLV